MKGEMAHKILTNNNGTAMHLELTLSILMPPPGNLLRYPRINFLYLYF